MDPGETPNKDPSGPKRNAHGGTQVDPSGTPPRDPKWSHLPFPFLSLSRLETQTCRQEFADLPPRVMLPLGWEHPFPIMISLTAVEGDDGNHEDGASSDDDDHSGGGDGNEWWYALLL